MKTLFVRTVPRRFNRPAAIINGAVAGALALVGAHIAVTAAQARPYGYGQGFSSAPGFLAFPGVVPSVGLPPSPSPAPWYGPRSEPRVAPRARIRQLREPAPPNGCVRPAFLAVSGDDRGTCYR